MTTEAITTTTQRTGTLARALEEDAANRVILCEFVSKQMMNGTDYGVIPGTGDKDDKSRRTLLKAGAEKLTSLFRCEPQYDVTQRVEDWSKPFPLFDYEFRCRLVAADGRVVAEGHGSANSYESRYRWRKASRACPKCNAETIIKGKEEYGGGWLCFAKKGGCGAKFVDKDPTITGQVVGRVENTDGADVKNTVLKIAKKRALVDAAIALARCSDLFTQDLEDLQPHQAPDDDGPAPDDEPAAQSRSRKPSRQETASKPTPTDTPSPTTQQRMPLDVAWGGPHKGTALPDLAEADLAFYAEWLLKVIRKAADDAKRAYAVEQLGKINELRTAQGLENLTP